MHSLEKHQFSRDGQLSIQTFFFLLSQTCDHFTDAKSPKNPFFQNFYFLWLNRPFTFAREAFSKWKKRNKLILVGKFLFPQTQS